MPAPRPTRTAPKVTWPKTTWPKTAETSLGRRFARAEGGASAVEFALVSAPFLMLLAAILQTTLMIWTAHNLEDSLQRAGRTIYTGSFQKLHPGQADPKALLAGLKAAMCGTNGAGLAAAFDCSTLRLDVAAGGSFAGGSVPSPLDPQTKTWANGFGEKYTCAQPGTIVVVTAAVKYRVAFSFLYAGIPGFADGSRLLQSTAAFRTEPYDTTSATAC